ncbi:MAG: tetratricopeptide repeat protein [Verrucomicrobia bacterium]|nr:tetratricopeptide repeat protein [Verrucomicrobiota bacterium]
MEKPWYQRMFRDRPPPLPSTKTKAENGDAEAQFDLAVMLACGEGEARDYGQAIHWYTKAADQDHSMAQLNLGMMYSQGQGVVRDEAQAIGWITKSAEHGDAGAQFNLGIRCQRSSLSESECEASESRIESYKWFHLAASQGYHEANASWEQVTLRMSHADVSQGNSRVAAFLAIRQAALPV